MSLTTSPDGTYKFGWIANDLDFFRIMVEGDEIDIQDVNGRSLVKLGQVGPMPAAKFTVKVAPVVKVK